MDQRTEPDQAVIYSASGKVIVAPAKCVPAMEGYAFQATDAELASKAVEIKLHGPLINEI